MSDSEGFVHDKDGFTQEKVDWIKELKEVRRGRIREYADEFGAEFHAGKRPWVVPVPGGVSQRDAERSGRRRRAHAHRKRLPARSARARTCRARSRRPRSFVAAGVAFGPGKAANAGGVSVSGLEQSQNALRMFWTREEVDQRLQGIMQRIHDRCVQHGRLPDGGVNYVHGANRAGFAKVADAMLANGVF